MSIKSRLTNWKLEWGLEERKAVNQASHWVKTYNMCFILFTNNELIFASQQIIVTHDERNDSLNSP